MCHYIIYNTVRKIIVKTLTSRRSLERFIINKCDGRSGHNAFTRKTKFSVEDLVAFMIMPRDESTAVELAEFSSFTHRPLVCKQTFFKKRRQLSDTVFDELNHSWLYDLYSSDILQRKWKGLYLFAFDGTSLKLPDTPDINATFPKGYNPQGTHSLPHAQAEVLKDLLNGMVIDIKTADSKTPEAALAAMTIEELPKDLTDRSLFIFDRGYVGAAWFMWLNLHDIQYIVRVPRGWNKQVTAFFDSDEQTADVLVDMSRTCWCSKGRHSFEARGIDPDTCPPVMLHLVKCRLRTGETEVLAVRLKTGTVTPSEACWLYSRRWIVEITIDEFKNQLQLEVFSGNSVLCVLQDIKAKILAYNMGVTVAMKATDSLESKQHAFHFHHGEHQQDHDSGNHFRVKANLNIAWHYLKEAIPRILLTRPDEASEFLTETIKNLKRNVEEYVLDRHMPHNIGAYGKRGKYMTFTNYKRAI